MPIPIPVLSTVTFTDFLTSIPTGSALNNSDQILFLNNQGSSVALNKISKSDMGITLSDTYKGQVGSGGYTFNTATQSGYYSITNLSAQGGPWGNNTGNFTTPGVLEVRKTGSSIIQIATAPATSSGSGGYYHRIGTGNWTFVPNDFSNNSTVTSSKSGLMSPTLLATINSGLMTTDMITKFNAATYHSAKGAGVANDLSSKALGYYQIGFNSEGHITTASSFSLSNANNNDAGLMPSSMYRKLDTGVIPRNTVSLKWPNWFSNVPDGLKIKDRQGGVVQHGNIGIICLNFRTNSNWKINGTDVGLFSGCPHSFHNFVNSSNNKDGKTFLNIRKSPQGTSLGSAWVSDAGVLWVNLNTTLASDTGISITGCYLSPWSGEASTYANNVSPTTNSTNR